MPVQHEQIADRRDSGKTLRCLYQGLNGWDSLTCQARMRALICSEIEEANLV